MVFRIKEMRGIAPHIIETLLCPLERAEVLYFSLLFFLFAHTLVTSLSDFTCQVGPIDIAGWALITLCRIGAYAEEGSSLELIPSLGGAGRR